MYKQKFMKSTHLSIRANWLGANSEQKIRKTMQKIITTFASNAKDKKARVSLAISSSGG
jgi:hypothetical protein